MRDFKAWTIKETREGLRRYRFLALGAAFLFFALMDPLMMRFLPLILESQAAGGGLPPGLDLASLFPASREFGFSTFLGDLREIVSLVVCLALGGIIARERSRRTLILPFSKGASTAGMVLAKAAVYAIFLVLCSFAAVFIAYVYAGIVFPGSPFEPIRPLEAGAAYGLYFAYLVCGLVLASALLPSAIAASAAGLVLAYVLPALAGLLRFGEYLPSALADAVVKPEGLSNLTSAWPALTAGLSIAVCLAGAVVAMRKAEQ
jgi:ABC-2 type transport system permease protein